jgi:hypothetical protein
MSERDPMCLVSLFVSYLRKVQCDYCGANVYWHESDAISEAEHQILCCCARSICELRDNLRRICGSCDYQMHKDD